MGCPNSLRAGSGRTSAAAGLTLHRAPWVVTEPGRGSGALAATGPAEYANVLEDGGVVTCGGRILQAGPYKELVKKNPSASRVDHEAHVLTPALINAHAHLELSYLAAMGKEEPRDADLAGWISRLLARRDAFSGGHADILTAGRKALSHLHSRGVGLVADVGNIVESKGIGDNSPARTMFFLELLGFSTQASAAALARLDQGIDPELACTAHAPYSTSPELIKRLKARAAKAGTVLTIHVAESSAELEFLRTGGGPLKEMLLKRGALDRPFAPVIPPTKGTVDYLQALGVLDGTTLCVHAVHISASEISLLASRRAKVCLCPGSNQALGVGRAQVAAMLASGIRPALGTDSLASNPGLDLWQEMRILRQENPGIEPEAVFAMATRWGAEALGSADEWGALAPGRVGRFLAVRYDGPGRELFEFLTSLGEAAEPCWVS